MKNKIFEYEIFFEYFRKYLIPTLRSKHDPSSNIIRPPSQEAAQRVLIGTHMIGRQRSPEQTMNKSGIQSNGLGYASIEVSCTLG